MMQRETPLRIAIAEDNDEFRLTLRDIIAYEPDMEVHALWRNGRQVLDEIHWVKPDILLMDISMPMMDGIATMRCLRAQGVDTKVIMLTMHDDKRTVLRALRHGAASYLIKDGSVEEIIRAVREVASGRALIHPQVTSVLIDEMRRMSQLSATWRKVLTAREYDVLRELAKGKSNEQIAESLHITPKTVKNHVSHILSKLGQTDRAQAVLYAVRERWVAL